ncbi:MAG: UDP-N-acetylmuramoyl-L-alanine--D-glutamate ligase [Clostridia bacterium]|nr:UDP-N-acetylmuramoyl-L-alanine--D-glutamate ligase [Clostridia bacterium]
MDVLNQKFIVLGVSKSGFAVANYLMQSGADCYFFEELKSPKIDDAIERLTSLGAKRVSVEDVDKIISQIDVLVISPGAPINHPVAVKFKQAGKRIIGELEFGFLQFIPRLVAVTGTNGKTTTVTLIDSILKEANITSHLVGNIGVPLTSKVDSVALKDVVVAEVSSFQLESTNTFCPHISCILNVTPDHLERHYSMDNYIFLKKKIFKNQRESEYAILNFDDQTVKNFYTEIKAKVIWVSTRERVEGTYAEGGKIYNFGEYVMDEKDLTLRGEHNLCDALFAIAVCKLLGVSNDSIVNALKSFKGVKHRTELIATKGGIDFYNDSKATNTASTISALSMMTKPVILILGGSEKGEKYDELFQKIKEYGVKQVVLMGASRFNMLDCAGNIGYHNITMTNTFESAVKIANIFAKDGDAVLLSPACASFDSFSGYEERGEKFVKLVEEL